MKPLQESLKNLDVVLQRVREQFVISTKPVENITYKLCDYKSGSTLPSTQDFVPFTKGTTSRSSRRRKTSSASTSRSTSDTGTSPKQNRKRKTSVPEERGSFSLCCVVVRSAG